MKKRPKLSLSAGKDVDKKQALDFDVVPPAEPEALPAEVETPRERASVQAPGIREESPVPAGSSRSGGDGEATRPTVNATASRPTVETRPSQATDIDVPSAFRGKHIVKTLLVVAVAALSLYLLKRRFF